MLVFSHERINLLLRACSLLNELGDETAHLKFSDSTLNFITRPNTDSHHFFAVLDLQPPFFQLPSISPPLYFFYSRIDQLKEFCDHLTHGIDSSSMDFTLSQQDDHHYPPLITLTFHDSGTSKPPFSRAIRLSYPEKSEDIWTTINPGRFVSINSQRFRGIVKRFKHVDKVDVTLTNLQVIFSSGYKKKFLNKQEGECIIGGVEVGEKMEFSIKLSPTKFFYHLIFLTERVWFYETTNGDTVILAPIALAARFEIHFLNLV